MQTLEGRSEDCGVGRAESGLMVTAKVRGVRSPAHVYALQNQFGLNLTLHDEI